MKNINFKYKFLQNKTVYFIFFILLVFYLGNFKLKPWDGDSLVFRYLPYSFLNNFHWNLDEFYGQLLEKYAGLIYSGSDGEKLPYYLIKVNGHYLSGVGVGPAILAIPILFIPIVFFHFSPESWLIIFLIKLTASILIALSAVFVFLSARAFVEDKKAFLITFIYALCSNLWSSSSQALLQQTGSEFFLALSIYFLTRVLKEPRFISYLAFALASSIFMRPVNIAVMLIITIYVIHRHKNNLLKYVFGASLPLIFILWYNWHYHGSPFLFAQSIYNPYSAMYKTGSSELWSTPLLVGLKGILFSPNRGLFIYSPVFIFSFVGIILSWLKKEYILFRYLSVVTLVIIIAHSKFYDWWGGWSFGPRAINDSIAFLSMLFIPFMKEINFRNKILTMIFSVLIVFSFFIQIIGAFKYDNSWESNPDIDTNQYRLWLWQDSQILYYLKKFFSKN